MKKKILTGREDVHPQTGLNRLILNWCIGGCWFIPAHCESCLDFEWVLRFILLLLLISREQKNVYVGVMSPLPRVSTDISEIRVSFPY